MLPKWLTVSSTSLKANTKGPSRWHSLTKKESSTSVAFTPLIEFRFKSTCEEHSRGYKVLHSWAQAFLSTGLLLHRPMNLWETTDFMRVFHGKLSMKLSKAQLFHQHHTEFHCKAKASNFLLEMQIKTLVQKAFVSVIKKIISPKFFTSFSSSALLISLPPAPCSKSLFFVQDSGQISQPLRSFPDKTCLAPWGHHNILSASVLGHLHLYFAVLCGTFPIFASAAFSRAT